MWTTQKEKPLAIYIPPRTSIAGGFSVLSFFIYLISLALSHPFLNLDCSLLGFLFRFRSLTNQCSTVLQKRVTASPLLPLRYRHRVAACSSFSQFLIILSPVFVQIQSILNSYYLNLLYKVLPKGWE